MLESASCPRVWITAFWGFDPENDGYLGFTVEGNRRWFLENWREGDLVLIYGADAPTTAPEQRHQALGFLEIEPTLIKDIDRMSPIGIQRKIDNDWKERWTFATPVIRAARITRRISIDHIASKTLTPAYARIIASRGILLSPGEAEKALALPVRLSNVFGQPALPLDQLQTEFAPSRGIDPVFGDFILKRSDGEHFLYALLLTCDVARMLNRRPFEVRDKLIMKVGYSNDPTRRCVELNSALPPAMQVRWKPEFISRAFSTGQSAKDAEDGLKAHLARVGESLGNEFYLCSRSDLQTAFIAASRSTAAFSLSA